MKQPVEIDHYKTLGIAASATQAEVKQAYRKLAKQLHPDSQTAQSNHDKIAQVNAAYEVLGDASERQQYDTQRQQIASAAASQRSARSASAAAAATSQYKKRQARSGSTTIEQWLLRLAVSSSISFNASILHAID